MMARFVPTQIIRYFVGLWMITRGTWSVTLNKVLVPPLVENGTEPYVILDCIYMLNHSEKDGMILKWYFNGKTVYQWIPPAKPQGVGTMRGRINLDYESSTDPYERHRALYLNQPTIDMTGDYTCKVSTLQNDVAITKKMTVFVPPRRVQINHRKGGGGPAGDSVNVTCLADYVYPEPKVLLYHSHGNTRVRLKGVTEKRARYHGGAWQKIVFVDLTDKSLKVENTFECVVSLPHTEYVIKRRTMYSPSNPTVMASASNSSPAESLGWLKFFLWTSSWLVKMAMWR